MLKNKQPTAVNIRATMQQQHLASARNRRLAQQMENRPSVQAALHHKQVSSVIPNPATQSYLTKKSALQNLPKGAKEAITVSAALTEQLLELFRALYECNLAFTKCNFSLDLNPLIQELAGTSCFSEQESPHRDIKLRYSHPTLDFLLLLY